MRGRLASYTHQRLKRLRASVKAFVKSDEPELLHKARVEIKRIKAILGLLQFNRAGFIAHRAYKPFRNIFRACNNIREHHVMHSMAKKIVGNSIKSVPCHPSLVEDFRKEIPAFIKVIKEQEKALLKEIKKLRPRAHARYLKKKKMELKENIYPKLLQRELHHTRKLLKEIHYLEAITKKPSKLEPFYKESAELIGRWHDKINLIARLRKSAPARPALIKKLQKENTADLRQLKMQIAQFYESK